MYRFGVYQTNSQHRVLLDSEIKFVFHYRPLLFVDTPVVFTRNIFNARERVSKKRFILIARGGGTKELKLNVLHEGFTR